MAKAYIIASVRTAVGRAYKGSLKDTRPDDLGAAAIRAALDRVPNLDPARNGDREATVPTSSTIPVNIFPTLAR